jgi:hypothetical protein
MIAALHAAGMPVLVEPSAGYAHHCAYVTDPDGNWIALIGKQDR